MNDRPRIWKRCRTCPAIVECCCYGSHAVDRLVAEIRRLQRRLEAALKCANAVARTSTR